jgi:hypothetical protein
MRPLLVAFLSCMALLGCATPNELFLDRAHRANFSLQLDELKSAQFYVSEEILAREVGPSGDLEGPDHVFVVPRGTRGVVTEAGPHWLRVSFGAGDGALFVANADAKTDSVYLLATDGEAGRAPVRVRDLPDKVLSVGGRRFRVITGSGASLLIDDDDLSRLVGTRYHAPGRESK